MAAVKRTNWPGVEAGPLAAKPDPDPAQLAQLPTATLAQFCDHIDYLINLAGPDHVGIGGDFFGGQQPEGLEDASVYPALFAELIRRGHGEHVLTRIAGANFVRVMRKVERVGRMIEKELQPIVKTRVRRASRKPAAKTKASSSLTPIAATRPGVAARNPAR